MGLVRDRTCPGSVIVSPRPRPRPRPRGTSTSRSPSSSVPKRVGGLLLRLWLIPGFSWPYTLLIKPFVDALPVIVQSPALRTSKQLVRKKNLKPDAK
jgi:hypothetical protein